MILGFKDQFIPYIEEGSKTHTIRGGERWRVGMRADLFRNVRQKNMRLIYRAPVVRVQEIRIVCDPKKRADGYPSEKVSPLRLQTEIYIEGEQLDAEERDLFAWRDGFRALPKYGYWGQMVQFWAKQHGLGRRICEFHGQIVHWDYAARVVDLPEKAKRRATAALPVGPMGNGSGDWSEACRD